MQKATSNQIVPLVHLLNHSLRMVAVVAVSTTTSCRYFYICYAVWNGIVIEYFFLSLYVTPFQRRVNATNRGAFMQALLFATAV